VPNGITLNSHDPTDSDVALPDRAAGLTVDDVASRLRVSPDKVRAWIARGELKAVNTSANLCGKPRWVIPPEALAEFEKRRTGGPPPKPQRRRRQAALVDFYPD
jgi:excisionase family DNA binding protein